MAASTAAIFTLTLAIWCAGRTNVAYPTPLRVDATFAPASAGRAEPLISSGVQGAGDALFVRFIDPQTIVFGYDSWAQPLVLGTVPVHIRPNRSLRLAIEMPSLERQEPVGRPHSGRVRVRCNDTVVLDSAAAYYGRNAPAHFGENFVGSSWCQPVLVGNLTSPDGTVLHGSSAPHVSSLARISYWPAQHPRQVIAILLLGMGLWCGTYALAEKSRPAVTVIRWTSEVLNEHRWFLAITVGCALVFTAAITRGTFDLFAAEPHGVFYDYQASSLLHGRLDVPEYAIAGEAFVANGKYYGYFGPTPAILRLPIIVFDIGVGRLTRFYMLGYFVATLAAAYMILRDATRWATGRADAMPTPWSVALILTNAGLGSTLLFLGARAMMYHEAILCGATFALWSGWCSLRQLATPTRRWWLGALLFGLGSVQARPPTGLFALTLLGIVVAYQTWRGVDPDPARTTVYPPRRWRGGAIVLAAFAATLSFNAVGYLKFKTFDGAPLKLSQPYTPERLARVDGKSFHAANVPFGFYSYVVHANFRLERTFPYFYIGARNPGRAFPAAKIDLIDKLVAMPYAMPGLLLLTLFGSLAAIARGGRARSAVTLLWIAVLPMAIALFAAIAIAQRYSADFCPFLIALSCFGVAAIESWSTPWRRAMRTVAGALTVGAVFVTCAMTLDYEGNWAPDMPTAELQQYQNAFRRIDAAFGAKPQ